ncbi:uncharacterized protein LOC105643541 isoform X2 [Jatropha curcas]|uniref:uncharacterized protein LOC105643541 isoform X2 n=1 Tax=Jatropha curcas TaxID=180498 RepID=UPI0005FB8DE1|nr:uncharacterized protein LOC105643541 isoform X2 [Jatropha curcas]
MLENPTPAAQPDSTSVVKRYAPPNQRNRSLNRRKSGERFDRSNSLYANEAEKNQQHPPSRNMPVVDHGDVGSSNFLKGNSRPGLIALEGCSRSEAAQLLNDRWTLAMHNYDDASIDLSATFLDMMGGYNYNEFQKDQLCTWEVVHQHGGDTLDFLISSCLQQMLVHHLLVHKLTS